MNNDMPADHASADLFDMLVDIDGCVWVRLSGDRWSYLTDEGSLGWDVRDVLPEEYQPYRPLDAAATAIIKAHLAVAK